MVDVCPIDIPTEDTMLEQPTTKEEALTQATSSLLPLKPTLKKKMAKKSSKKKKAFPSPISIQGRDGNLEVTKETPKRTPKSYFKAQIIISHELQVQGEESYQGKAQEHSQALSRCYDSLGCWKKSIHR